MYVILSDNTVNIKRFARLNFCRFNPTKFSQENSHGVLNLKYLNNGAPIYK